MPSDSSSSITSGPTHHHPHRRSPDVVPRRRTLRGFVEAVPRVDGIGLVDVDAFTALVVPTRKSVHRVTILSHTGTRCWSKAEQSSPGARALV